MTSKQQLIEAIIRDVCELPDYNSPDDQPDLLQCTVQELDAILDRHLQVETGCYPEYTNAIGDAGSQYIQRCGGRISSGTFYWHELWDALNAAAYSLEHVRQSPQGSVPAIGAPTAPAAPGSSQKTSDQSSGRIEKQEPLT